MMHRLTAHLGRAPGWLGLLTLIACSAGGADSPGGGGGGGSGGGGAVDASHDLTAASEFSPDDIEHLLARTQFGVTTAQLASIQRIGVPAFVDAMLQFAPAGTTTAETEAHRLLERESDPVGLEGKFPSSTQLAQWWTHLLCYSDNAFQESLALFWHDHFGVSTEALSGSRRHWMKDHVDLLRGQGAGNLRILLQRVATDPAMLEFLDGTINTKVEPNENFAREFFELFTLGVDNGYEEHDIREAARAFTGYRSRFNSSTGLSQIEFDEERHDVGAKVIFDSIIRNGSTEDDYITVANLTLDEKPVAEFICRKLLIHYGMDEPADELIHGLAATLRAAEYELAPMLRQLFLSRAFYSDQAKARRIASPIEFVVGLVRTTGLAPEVDDIERSLRDMGHRPTRPPGVDGWVRGELWLSAQGMVERANFAERAIAARDYQQSVGVDLRATLPAEATVAADVIQHFASLLRLELTGDELDQLAFYLDTYRNSNDETVLSTLDLNDQDHLDERVRGLIYILAQHPQAMLR